MLHESEYTLPELYYQAQNCDKVYRTFRKRERNYLIIFIVFVSFGIIVSSIHEGVITIILPYSQFKLRTSDEEGMNENIST